DADVRPAKGRLATAECSTNSEESLSTSLTLPQFSAFRRSPRRFLLDSRPRERNRAKVPLLLGRAGELFLSPPRPFDWFCRIRGACFEGTIAAVKRHRPRPVRRARRSPKSLNQIRGRHAVCIDFGNPVAALFT